MGCPSSCVVGDNLVFSIATHDPDTGELTDADEAPSYRVYEDETATPILTGTLSKLDDANTTGFYTELIACTAGNGFEDGKTYTIYVQATVDTAIGGITFAFKAVAAPATAAKLLDYIQLLARSDSAIFTDNATALGEINANEGSGAGNYAKGDSQEGMADDLSAGISDNFDEIGDVKAVVDDNEGYLNQIMGTGFDTDTDSLAVRAAARGEPGQGNPPASASTDLKVDYLFKNWRNKKTEDATTLNLYNDAGDTVDQKATVSDADGTATKGEIGTGA